MDSSPVADCSLLSLFSESLMAGVGAKVLLSSTAGSLVPSFVLTQFKASFLGNTISPLEVEHLSLISIITHLSETLECEWQVQIHSLLKGMTQSTWALSGVCSGARL